MSMMTGKETGMHETMKKVAVAGLMALVAAGVTLPLAAQQAPAAAKAPRVVIETEAQHRAQLSGSSDKKPGDGITIHGHWIIDVRNADGSLAEHRDFYNALQPTGGSFLGAIMDGLVVPSQLYITVGGGTHNGYVMYSSTSLVGDPSCTFSNNTSCFPGLTQQLTSAGLVLSGQFQASVADSLTLVATNLVACETKNSNTGVLLTTTVPASACNSSFQSASPGSGSTPYNTTATFSFTQRDLTVAPSTALNVTAGQTVSVSVTISFS